MADRQRKRAKISPPKQLLEGKLVQTYLDLGQKRFDSTQCDKCSMVYTPGVEDSKHERYCAAQRTLRWRVDTKLDDKVLEFRCENKDAEVVVSSPARCKRLATLVDCSLGFSEGPNESSLVKCFVVVIQSQAVGYVEIDCAVIEARVLRQNTNCTSTDGVSEVCFGVKKLWVHPDFRRRGIASQLLDAARIQLGYPSSVPKIQIAFSQPSTMGRTFAESYFGEKEFLVYNL